MLELGEIDQCLRIERLAGPPRGIGQAVNRGFVCRRRATPPAQRFDRDLERSLGERRRHQRSQHVARQSAAALGTIRIGAGSPTVARGRLETTRSGRVKIRLASRMTHGSDESCESIACPLSNADRATPAVEGSCSVSIARRIKRRPSPLAVGACGRSRGPTPARAPRAGGTAAARRDSSRACARPAGAPRCVRDRPLPPGDAPPGRSRAPAPGARPPRCDLILQEPDVLVLG